MVEDGVQWLIDHGRELRTDALVYCDPPYLMETRRTKRRIYREEFTEDDHWRLLRVLLGLKCMVQISGYWSKLYAKRLSDWRLIRFQGQTRKGPREECLWMNYPEPVALHDFQYLGADYRERERIKRKTARWVSRMAALPILERTALFSAIAGSIATPGERIPQPGGIVLSGVSGSRVGNNDSGRGPSPDEPILASLELAPPETEVLQ